MLALDWCSRLPAWDLRTGTLRQWAGARGKRTQFTSSVVRHSCAQLGGSFEPVLGERCVLGNTVAVQEAFGIVDHAIGVAEEGTFACPFGGTSGVTTLHMQAGELHVHCAREVMTALGIGDQLDGAHVPRTRRLPEVFSVKGASIGETSLHVAALGTEAKAPARRRVVVCTLVTQTFGVEIDPVRCLDGLGGRDLRPGERQGQRLERRKR